MFKIKPGVCAIEIDESLIISYKGNDQSTSQSYYAPYIPIVGGGGGGTNFFELFGREYSKITYRRPKKN